MQYLKLATLAALAIPSGCVSEQRAVAPPAVLESRPPGRFETQMPLIGTTAPAALRGKTIDPSVQPEEISPSPAPASAPEYGVRPGGSGQIPARDAALRLTLAGAVTLALQQNPELSANVSEVRARQGALLQAGLLPNPVLSASAGSFGNSVLRDFDGPTATVSLSQLIQLGGKRAKAVRLAQLDRDLAVWDFESKRMDIITRVVQSFVEVLGAQEQKALADDLAALAERVAEAIASRVRAGKASPVEETRARVSLASVSIDRMRAERELAAAKQRLAATWGETDTAFDRVEGRLEEVKPLPTLDSLLARLNQNPDLARWASEIARRQAAVGLAESHVVPDLTVSLGLQQFFDTDDSAIVAGLSLPLPVFNRNQGNIEAANQRLDKATVTRRNIEVTVATAMNTTYQRLAAARAEVDGYRSAVLPGAETAFDAVQKGYRLGKFALLDVLDTQRTLFTARAQYLRALVAYHQGVAEVERLIGTPIFEESK